MSTSQLQETATQERDLSSAPIDPGGGETDAAAPASGCYCPDVTVRCAKAGAYHARADRATCTLDLPEAACALFGFETGTIAHPEAILATAGPADLGADDVYELCSVKHEAYHACDGAMTRPCEFEVAAYDVTLECMSAYAADPKVAHNVEGVRAARDLNACVCEATSCAACTARCKSDHPAFGATCDQAEQVYCQ